MKTKLYLLLTALLTTAWSVDVAAQNIGLILAEDFEDGTLPADWTRVQTAGSDGWTFGVTEVTSDGVNTLWDVPASPDASQFAISNDDLCNCTADNDQLNSPTMDWTGYDSVYVFFDYFYDQAFNLSQAYFTISYDDGASWLYLALTENAAWVDDQLIIAAPEIVVEGVTYTFTDQMKIGFLHIDAGGWASGFAVDDVLIGGWNDPCEDIVTIPSCGAPQTVTAEEGFGVVDWQFNTGCGFTTFGKEQLYSFTPSVSGVHTLDVTAATGTSFLDYMYKPATLGCDTLNWTCLGDANAPESYGMNLTAGIEYLILVDNEFIDAETQTFQITCPCSYTSLGNDPESETCGADLNGGCNNDPGLEAYEPIACGQSISGTLWSNTTSRDTDWFELVVTENTTITVDYSGGMPINAILTDDCDFTTVLGEATSAGCGSGNITYSATPGTYLLVIAPTAFGAYSCGIGSGLNDYDITVTYCEPTVAVDPCLTSAETYIDLNNAGGAPCNDGGGCSTTDPDFTTLGFGLYGSETYLLSNVQAGFDYVFDMCTGVGAGSWIPEIAIIAPDGTTIDAWNGEAFSGSSLTFLDQCSLAWTATQSGTYSIIINQLGTAAGDAPDQVDCETTYEVDNGNPTVTCGPNGATCPPVPGNDECAAAFPLQVNQTCVSISGDVNFASESAVACTGDANSDVWYSFDAVSSEATIDVAGSASFDAVFEVFEGSCAGTSLACVDATLLGETETATLTALTPGNTYYIRVHDYFDRLIPTTTTFDICVYSSPVTGVAEAEQFDVNVYPNPSNGEFTIELNGAEGNAQLVVTDMVGKVVYSEATVLANNYRKELNLGLPAGSYLLTVAAEKHYLVEKLEIK